jgi:hypothetical protein
MKPRGMMVIHQFRPIASGAELQAERLAIRLVQRGHEMQVFTELRVPGSLSEEEIQGLQVHRVSFKMAYQIISGMESTFQYLICMYMRHLVMRSYPSWLPKSSENDAS